MHGLARWIARYKGIVTGILGPLGFWGALLAGAVDGGTVPIPVDALIATWAWNNHHMAWLFVLMAAAGSALGGLIPFLLGRAGGEIFILRRVDRPRYEAMMARFEKQEFLALAIPSIMPPPTPWKAFVFCAGVFEMKIWLFLLAVFTGRVARYGIEAALTILYGPKIIEAMADLFQHHLMATLVALGILLAGLVAWGWRRRHRRHLPPGA